MNIALFWSFCGPRTYPVHIPWDIPWSGLETLDCSGASSMGPKHEEHPNQQH